MKKLCLKHVCKWTEITILGAMAAFSTVDVGHSSSLASLNDLALLPIANYTETPDAAQRAYIITQNVLYQPGFTQRHQHPQNQLSHALKEAPVMLSETDALE